MAAGTSRGTDETADQDQDQRYGYSPEQERGAADVAVDVAVKDTKAGARARGASTGRGTVRRLRLPGLWWCRGRWPNGYGSSDYGRAGQGREAGERPRGNDQGKYRGYEGGYGEGGFESLGGYGRRDFGGGRDFGREQGGYGCGLSQFAGGGWEGRADPYASWDQRREIGRGEEGGYFARGEHARTGAEGLPALGRAEFGRMSATG